jgi:hypothetical protein
MKHTYTLLTALLLAPLAALTPHTVTDKEGIIGGVRARREGEDACCLR